MDWLQQRGIVHEVAAPYSQFQNGVAERRIGLLNKSTKAMLYASGLPMADWYHAMEYAAYLYSIELFQILFLRLMAIYLPIKYSTKGPLTMYPKGFLAATFCQKFMSKEKWLQPQQNEYG